MKNNAVVLTNIDNTLNFRNTKKISWVMPKYMINCIRII